MKILKKIGSILFCLLPVLLAFGIQIAASVGCVILKIIFLVISDPASVQNLISPNYIMSFLVDSQFLAGVSALYAVIAGLALGFWYWKRFVPKKQPRREVSSIINLRMFGGLVLLMVGMQYVSTYIVFLVSAINPAWFDAYEALMESIGFEDVSLLLATYSIIIAPISEEIIFRGVTMKYATKTMPFFLANIFQALLFGLFHGNVVQGTYAFTLGLFLGYVCQKGGSIYLSILLHMLFNLWGTFQPDFLSYSGDAIWIHLLIVIAAIGLTAAGFFLYKTGISKRTPMPEAYQHTLENKAKDEAVYTHGR